MRITIVATSTRAWGAETEALQLGQRLRDSGHHCSNFALAPGGGPADSPVTTLGATTLGLDTLRALRREAKKSDVVVAYGSSTLPACAIALAGVRTPFVYRSIGDPRTWVAGALHRRRTSVLFRRAARVVALWDGAAQDIVDLYGVSPARVTSIPNARDPDQFRPASKEERASARAELGLAADEQVVVTLGALEPEKRVDLAIRTMALIPSATLLVVGDGSQRSALEHLANNLQPSRVHFLGHVNDPRSVMHAGDLLLLTSSTEGMPGVVLEAGFSGLPVVATRVGMVHEMVVNGSTGYVVESDSVDELAGAVEEALVHRVELGRAARARMSERFTWEAALPAWSALLGEVAGQRTASRPRLSSSNRHLADVPWQRYDPEPVSAQDPIVVAVVVTYRRHDVVRATLREVLAQPGLSAVVLVDNGDDLPVVVAPEGQPEVVQLTSPANEGFGAGLAIGMSYARRRFDPDYYWLMDDDSAPHPGALGESLTVARTLENLGSVNTRAGSYRRGRIRHHPDLESGPPRPTDWTLVDGALISRTAVEVAGVPRSDLFMALEDFEYTIRIAEAGFTNYQRAGSVSTPQHLGSASDWRHYYQARNLLRFSVERRSLWGVIGWVGREARIQTMLLVRGRPRAIFLRWRGAVDAVLGRMGRQVNPS